MSEVNLGETLRRLRRLAHLSLRSLGAKTGFSASFLSQVENGQASPSIASMERIAVALGVTMGQVFDKPAQAEPLPAVVRASARIALTSGWSNARIESLGTSGSEGRLKPVVVTLAPGGKSGARPYPSQREEFALILQGTVVLTLEEHGRGEGDPVQEHELRRGDAVTIPVGVGRRWQNLSRAPVKVMLVSAPV